MACLTAFMPVVVFAIPIRTHTEARNMTKDTASTRRFGGAHAHSRFCRTLQHKEKTHTFAFVPISVVGANVNAATTIFIWIDSWWPPCWPVVVKKYNAVDCVARNNSASMDGRSAWSCVCVCDRVPLHRSNRMRNAILLYNVIEYIYINIYRGFIFLHTNTEAISSARFGFVPWLLCLFIDRMEKKRWRGFYGPFWLYMCVTHKPAPAPAPAHRKQSIAMQ